MDLNIDLIDIELEKNIGLCNMTDEFFCWFINSILHKHNKNILVVVNSLYEANQLYNRMSNYNINTCLFPMDDFLTSEALAISPDLRMKRLDTLNYITSHSTNIVITNLMGYLRYLPKKELYLDFILNLKVGDIISPKELENRLVSLGYIRDSLVNQTGEFAVRGFIIDIFIFQEENPIRIEFFDDEIESIRYFDVDSQRSKEETQEIIVKPFFEFLTKEDVSSDYMGKQKYLPLYSEVDSISNYLDDCYTFFKDFNIINSNYINMLDEIDEYRNTKDLNFKGNYMFSLNDIVATYPLYYYSLNNIDNSSMLSKMISFDVKTINNFNDNAEFINRFIRDYINSGKTVIILLKEYQIKSIKKHLNMSFVESTFDNIQAGKVNLIEHDSTQGFIYEDFVILTARELFKEKDSKKKYNNSFRYATSIKDIDKLDIGDYVVHNVHGIGIYNGIKTLTLHDISKDYLEVLYQGTDKIYIPVEKIDLLHKYSGREGIVPKVSKLGGNDWNRIKARVRSKVNDMADDLIKLYAERESRKGFAFSPDCELSVDFENDFPYELTIDQEKAIKQIKTDMESATPMDRLLCGDVGFGKTEVAFVAAFKAILDSKQVLFLCPTTILSNQHFENALVRFRNFPVTVELLNRFTTPRDVQRILKGLKDGTVDMVIGTHRLLSNDVILKDLGLLIIDEEQRFGVLHKEKIKQYKINVDVLTLTATPIPRTLQMSLVGIRSLSLIETPPVNRYPVQTYVVEENKQILRDAIYKELARNGQVFILYNRVQSIEEFSNRIQLIVPDARIGIAHGQMNKNDLENTIFDFVNYRFDILICTTIIETGIDIPNVNTLIIIDADHFGLSQLYQIRGRVGRSDKFAYAYLMYQPFKTLTDTAVKRLNVIKEFTELGSGFAIATRDLSIRGAGDILGSEQAGFIDSVGIDLYLKMLEEEIAKRNNNDIIVEEKDESRQLIDVTTHIDDNYIAEDDLKIEVHRLISSISSRESFESVRLELEDRFGKLSDDLIIYMYEEWFEKLAKIIPVTSVRQTKNSIELLFSNEVVAKMNTEDIFMIAMDISHMFRFLSRGNNLVIVLDIIKLDKHPIYYLVSLLDKIYENISKSID